MEVVEDGGRVFSSGARGLELGAVESGNLELRLLAKVRAVVATELRDEAVFVEVVPVVDRFPGPLGDGIDFVGVASYGALGLSVRSDSVSSDGRERFDIVGADRILNGFGAPLCVVKDALTNLPTEGNFSFAGFGVKLVVSVPEANDVLEFGWVVDVETVQVLKEIGFAFVARV